MEQAMTMTVRCMNDLKTAAWLLRVTVAHEVMMRGVLDIQCELGNLLFEIPLLGL